MKRRLWVVGFIAIYEFLILSICSAHYTFHFEENPICLISYDSCKWYISLVVSGLDYHRELTDPYDSDWFWIMHSLISAPLKVILLTSAIEFVCAQLSCWYKMRDIATPYRWVEDAFEKYLASDNHII